MSESWRQTKAAWQVILGLYISRLVLGFAMSRSALLGTLAWLTYWVIVLAVALTVRALGTDLIQDRHSKQPRRYFGTMALLVSGAVWLVGQICVQMLPKASLLQLLNGIVTFIYALSIVPILSILGLIFDKDRKRAIAGTVISVIALILGNLR